MELQLQREQRHLQLELARADGASAERVRAASAHSAAEGASAEHSVQKQRLLEEERSLSDEEASWASSPEMVPLQTLLARQEQLKQQQADFKRERARDEQGLQLERARQEEAASNSHDSSHLQEVAQLFADETHKAQKLRRLVGQKSREAALLQRRIDDMPTRAELMQYERRFRELYQQVASKSQETKKYFSSFNILEEKKSFICKEVSLINSIHENYNKSQSGNRDKVCSRHRPTPDRCSQALSCTAAGCVY